MVGDALTPREREVLALITEGKTNAEISHELGISFPTAKAHVSSVLAKLGVESREEAARAARPAGRWRNLVAIPLAVGLGAAAMSVGVFLLVRQVAPDETEARTLQVPLTQLADGQPHHYELHGFGESPSGTPYGAWLTLQPGGQVTAFFDRDPHTGCAVPWKPDQKFGDFYRVASSGPARPDEYVPPGIGAYRDGCGGWMYLKEDGAKVFGASPRGLDSFRVTVGEDTVVVDLESVVLGICAEPSSLPDCSTAERPVVVAAPPSPAIPDWGRRGNGPPSP